MVRWKSHENGFFKLVYWPEFIWVHKFSFSHTAKMRFSIFTLLYSSSLYLARYKLFYEIIELIHFNWERQKMGKILCWTYLIFIIYLTWSNYWNEGSNANLYLNPRKIIIFLQYLRVQISNWPYCAYIHTRLFFNFIQYFHLVLFLAFLFPVLENTNSSLFNQSYLSWR